jgi:hypothetical protein
MRHAPVAGEPFRLVSLPGRLRPTAAGVQYGDGLDEHVAHLHVDLDFRTFPLSHYSVLPLAADKCCYWERPGDTAPTLRHYYTHEALPEEARGEPLTYYLAAFRRAVPDGRLVAIISFGDCGVNLERGLLTRESLVWVPSSAPSLVAPRPWLVCYRTGLITVESLALNVDGREGALRLRECRASSRKAVDVRHDIEWAISGLPVIVNGRVNDCVYELDDDLRHLFVLPAKNGLYVGEKALKDARAHGWRPLEPLEIDLAPYGEEASTIDALLRAGYQQVFRLPALPGEFQLLDPRRILCRLETAGYGLGVVGLCHDGSLGSYMAKAPATAGGYFCPSVADQIRMLQRSFTHAFVLEEGLDPTFYDTASPIRPEDFPVRGKAGGRLSAVLCIYE